MRAYDRLSRLLRANTGLREHLRTILSKSFSESPKWSTTQAQEKGSLGFRFLSQRLADSLSVLFDCVFMKRSDNARISIAANRECSGVLLSLNNPIRSRSWSLGSHRARRSLVDTRFYSLIQIKTSIEKYQGSLRGFNRVFQNFDSDLLVAIR